MADRLAGAVIALLSRFCRLLPRRALLATGKAAGAGMFRLAAGRRRTALRNLTAAMGDVMSPAQVHATVRGSFAHLGMNLAEFLAFPSLDGPSTLSLVRFEGEENLHEALARGRGALILSAHLGNWDMLSAALARRGYDLAIVSKVSRSAAVNRVWMGFREAAGIRVLTGRGVMRHILRHLRGGGVVGFVLDQNALRDDGVFVPFFGRPACTLSSLAVIARRTGAPVVPVYTFREGMGHRAVIGPPMIEPRIEDHDRDVLERTARYARWTEEAIRRHPDQWTWLHDRWRTRPAERDEGTGECVNEGASGRESAKPVTERALQRQEGGVADSPFALHPSPSTARLEGSPAAAVFLDRDGTILDEEGYLGRPEGMRIYPFAAEALRMLQRAGYALVVVTNQSGVGRGHFEEVDALAVNLAMVQSLLREGVRLGSVLYCPHPPDGGCACRKPATLMIERSVTDLAVETRASWMVGDTARDIEAGLAGGLRAVLVSTGKDQKGPVPTGVRAFPDLLHAARWIALAGDGREAGRG